MRRFAPQIATGGRIGDAKIDVTAQIGALDMIGYTGQIILEVNAF